MPNFDSNGVRGSLRLAANQEECEGWKYKEMPRGHARRNTKRGTHSAPFLAILGRRVLTAGASLRPEHSIRVRRHSRITAEVYEGFARDGHWRHSV